MDPLMFQAIWDQAPSPTPRAKAKLSDQTPLRPRVARALRRMADAVEPAPKVAAPASC